MQDLLEKIWYGQLEMPSEEIRKREAYKTMADERNAFMRELRESMTKEQKERFDTLMFLDGKMDIYCEKESFIRGVRMGIQFANVLNTEKGI